MKTLPFIMFASLILASAASAHGATPATVGATPIKPAMVCPQNAMCAPLPTPHPVRTPLVCPPWAMCVPLPKHH
jgi:hypothetical protein